MSYPTALSARSIGGSVVPSYLTTTLANSYSTGQTFTIANAATWLEIDSTGHETSNPLGTSGAFVVGVDVGLSTEEHILCSAVNVATGVVTVWTDGTLNGRAYDGTTISAHNPGTGTDANCYPIAAAAWVLQDNAQIIANASNLASKVASVNAGTGVTISGPSTAPIVGLTPVATAGTTGDASHTLSVTINAQGQVTAISANAISVPHTDISDWATAIATALTGYYNTAGTGLIGSGSTVALANTAVTAGTYGDGSHTLSVTINAQGQVTSVTANAISITHGQISDWATATSGFVTGVTAADSTITVGGTSTAPTVKVAAGTFDAAGAASTAQAAAIATAETFATNADSVVLSTAETFATNAVAAETTRAETAEALLIPLAQKGASNGVATLDGSGKVPSGQLPVDPGNVASVTAGDATITIGGTGANPTVKVTPSTYLPLSGGTMSGAIAMGSNKITGLTDGSASTDAATVEQLPFLNASLYGVSTASSDNTSAINSWLAACNSTGRTGFLDAGRYQFTGQIVLQSNVTVRGASAGGFSPTRGSQLKFTGTGLGSTTTSGTASAGGSQVNVNTGTLAAGSAGSPLVGTIETTSGNQSITYYVSGGVLYLTTGTFIASVASGAQVWNKVFNGSSIAGFTSYDIDYCYSDTSFAGALIDISGQSVVLTGITAHVRFHGGVIGGVNTNTTAYLVRCNNSYSVGFFDVDFGQGYTAIEGASSTSGTTNIVYNYTNGLVVEGCYFQKFTGPAIHNPGEGALISGATSEPTPGGVGNFILADADSGSSVVNNACTVIGGWIGDGTSGSWVSWRGGSFTSIGVQYGYQTVALTLTGNATAISFYGGVIQNATGAGMALGGYTVNSFSVLGVDWSNTTTHYTGLTGVASGVYSDSGTMNISGTLNVGAFSVSSSVTVPLNAGPNKIGNYPTGTLANAKNDAYLLTGLGDWVSFANSTVARDTSVASPLSDSGTFGYALKVTVATSAGGQFANSNSSGNLTPVTVGTPLTAMAYMLASGGNTITSGHNGQFRIGLAYYDSNNKYISALTAGTLSSQTDVNSSTWTQLISTATPTTSIGSITAVSVTNSTTVAFTQANTYTSGQAVTLSGFTGSLAVLNGSWTVLASGLSTSGYSLTISNSLPTGAQTITGMTPVATVTPVAAACYVNGSGAYNPVGNVYWSSCHSISTNSSTAWVAPNSAGANVGLSTTGITGGNQRATSFAAGSANSDLATVGQVALLTGATATGTYSAPLNVNPVHTVTVASNAGTCSALYAINNFTNSSAATMAITLSTTGAVDGQEMIVRVYDFSAASQTIGWTNTENSGVSAPTTSNGSTTLPNTVTFQYNSATSKWRCIQSC